MSGRRRAALTVVLMIVLAAAGAASGAALHWYVVQASDEELVAAANEVDLGSVVRTTEPVLSGAWAPSFDRGTVVWEAAYDEAQTGEDVADRLLADGWTIDRITERGAAQWVRASKGGLEVDVWARDSESGGTEITVNLERGDTTPSLAVLVAAGAVVGTFAGVAVSFGMRRRARSSDRREDVRTSPIG